MQGGKLLSSAHGVSCHYCAQKVVSFMAQCHRSGCELSFWCAVKSTSISSCLSPSTIHSMPIAPQIPTFTCPCSARCLETKHGEDVRKCGPEGRHWDCPMCRRVEGQVSGCCAQCLCCCSCRNCSVKVRTTMPERHTRVQLEV